jgi:predicted HTH transcriptional regulator
MEALEFMDALKLIKIILNGEDSYTQFKKDITNNDKLAEELVAFSNSNGGILIIGVSDNNSVVGLSDDDIRRLNQLIGNVINSNINPPIYPISEIKKIDDKKILLLKIDTGANKPYSTNKGIYLTKAGSDKRKISPQELRRLFAESKRLFADEEPVRETDIVDLNQQLFDKFLEKYDKKLYKELKSNDLNFKRLLQNFDIMRGENLTLAGNLIFGINPQRFNKSFYIDCCYFDGNDISVTKYINERRLYGDFGTLYTKATDFIKSNLINRQVDDNFNSDGVPEISHEVIGELVVNALIHRDYHINSPIKIYMFSDRVEIISPGKLFNSLTVEKIKLGTSIRRNQTLDRICNDILPYTGRGSGIKRALSINPNIEFINDIDKEEFKCIILRS